jgi:hypothetical protein
MFRRYVKFVVLLFNIFSSSLFAQWSEIVQITSGEFDDRNPVFASLEWPSNSYDWVVFTRTDSIGTNICVKRTTLNGRAWENDVIYITRDSFFNTSPSIAQQSYLYPNKMMIVWQTNRNGNNDIYYSFGDGLNWSLPMPISTNSSEDVNPQVARFDTTFIAVWESDGQIKTSLFLNNEWSLPMNVSDSADNTVPKVTSTRWSMPVVFWDKIVVDSVRVLYSFFKNNLWCTPRLLKTLGDKSNLSITKMFDNFGGIQVAWDQEGEIYGKISDFYSDTLKWGMESNLSNDELVHNKNASSVFFPIITKDDKQEYYYDVLVFEDSSSFTDNIHVKRSYWGWVAYDSLFNTNGVDKNPDVSCGVWELNGYNVWVVWQTNEGGRWHIVGTYTTIFWWGVEDAHTPEFLKLYQNYPNPFNPTTTISFYLEKPTIARLEIYNTLGVKVKTYFEENLQVGEHKIVWDGKDDKGRSLPSGVYYYRFTTDKSAQTRKMLLMR